MNCNCLHNNNQLDVPEIKHVQGNVLRIAIALTLRTVEKVNGEIQATDTPFIPSSAYPVKMEFSKNGKRVALDATMNGNVAFVEEKGKMTTGVYDITITCFDDNNNPYRFKQATALQIVDTTKEAGITQPIEYEVTTWYLDAAIFLALKGEDGVGIEDITVAESAEVGGENIVTIHLSNGEARSFSVLNGSGAVDKVLDILSPRPIANNVVTAKFNEIADEIANLFGNVDYDSQSKSIRFWDKGKTRMLASLDARPFIKDGMVNSVYISNNTLVITFNTDSGREAIGVPLSSVFNPNNYYNKTQVDNRIANAIAGVQVDTSGLMSKSEYLYPSSQSTPIAMKLKYLYLPPMTLDFIDGIGDAHFKGGGMIYGTTNGKIYVVDYQNREIEFGNAHQLVFLNKDDESWYRYDATNGWKQVGGSSSQGYDVSFANGNVIFSGSNQPTFSNGNIIL